MKLPRKTYSSGNHGLPQLDWVGRISRLKCRSFMVGLVVAFLRCQPYLTIKLYAHEIHYILIGGYSFFLLSFSLSLSSTHLFVLYFVGSFFFSNLLAYRLPYKALLLLPFCLISGPWFCGPFFSIIYLFFHIAWSWEFSLQ